jgi:O-antigen/teichoic acid export membrane protein
MLQLIRKIFPNQAFLKHVSTLAGGTAIAQFINFGVYFFIGRFYYPSDFGVFGLLTATAGVISVAAAGRFEVAIMIPHEKEKAKSLLRLSILVLGITVSVTFFLIALLRLAQSVSSRYIPVFHTYFFWIPFLVLILSLYQISSVWLNRHIGYRVLTLSRIVNASFNGALCVLFGLFHPGYTGLLVSYFLGSTSALLFISGKKIYPVMRLLKKTNKAESIAVAKEYKHFPSFNVPQALIDSLQFNMLIFLCGYFFSAELVGKLSFSLRILQMPLSFIGAAIAQVFYQQAADKIRNNETVFPLVRNTLKSSLLIFFPAFVALFFFGPFLFKLLFGSKWEDSGIIASLLIFWLYADFIRSPLSQVAIVKHWQKQWLLYSYIANGIHIFVFIICYYYSKDLFVCLRAIGTVAALTNIILILLLLKKSR